MDATQRKIAGLIAALVLVAAFPIAILLPRYACSDGLKLEYIEGPGANEWFCLRSDFAFAPDDRLPLKFATAVVGVVAAAIVLAVVARSRASDSN